MKKRLSVILPVTVVFACLLAIFVSTRAADNTLTAYCEHCKAEKVWYPVTGSAMNMNTAGKDHYYLSVDRVLTSQSITKSICLNLNGKLYTANKPITVNNGGTLSIQNGNILTRGNGTDAIVAGAYIKSGGNLNMWDVEVTYQNIAYKDNETRLFPYGGLFRVEGAMFGENVTMEGGYATVQGGNVFVGTTGSLTLNNSAVRDGVAPVGSCIYSAGKVTLSGNTKIHRLQLAPASGGPELAKMLTLQGACTGEMVVQIPRSTAAENVLATLNYADVSGFAIDLAGTPLEIREDANALVLKASEFAASVDMQNYTVMQEALAALTEGATLQLKRDVDALTIDKSVVLDLNGCNVGTLVAEGVTVYVKDSQTGDYDVADGLYGAVANIVGDVQAVAADVTTDPYLMITEENGTSFHAVSLNINGMTLKPDEAALYFVNYFNADQMVKEKVLSFGVAMSIGNEPTAATMKNSKHYTKLDAKYFGTETGNNGSLLYGIMKTDNGLNANIRNASVPVNGKAYIQIGENEYLFGVNRCRSLQEQVEKADALYAQVNWNQRDGLTYLYETYNKVLKNWSVPNLIHAEKELVATDLLTNNLDTPLGLDTTPVFRWTNESKTTGRAQSAYQIIVASTPELAAAHTGDVWDTGKVESDDSFDIPYEGKKLTSRTDYYWSVRVWDETGAESLWSRVCRFGTGILDQSEWTAKWIGGQVQTTGNEIAPAPMLRKGFELSDSVKKAKIYVCGLGLFELKVNGNLPDDSVLKPADTQYEDTVSYCAYDVTDLLTKGKNAITVELGGGFYNLSEDVSVNFNTGVWRDDPKLLLELHVEFENGSTRILVSDDSWRCYDDGPIRNDSIYCGEKYDATKEVEGWTSPDFDDSSWSKVRLADAPTGTLKFENMEPMRRVKAITPTVEKVDETTWRVYTGEFCTGWAKFSFDAPKDTEIQIRYYQREAEIARGLYLTDETTGEKLELQNYVYNCKGVPGETYEPKFSYAGYSVIEVTGYPGELKPEDVTCYTVATDVAHIGSFEAGNAMVNQLHELMVRTMVCNMQGKATDTPIFEKVGWTGDYNGAIKTFNYNFDTSSFVAHILQNVRDTAYDNGRVNEYSPSGQRAPSESPTWTQMYVNAIYAAWHENGQFSLVQEHYDYMCTQADYWIEKINKDEPWIWEQLGRLGDWASPYGSIDPTTMPSEGGTLYDTAAVYRVMKEMAEIAETMGEPERAKRYQDAADNIYIAFNEKFYNAEKGYYESGYWNGSTTRTQYRQSSNLVPLYFELCPEEYHDIVLQNLINDIVSKNYCPDVGHIGAELILPLLSKEGYGDVAMKILLQTNYPSWGYWLSLGATTALEGWNKGVRSYCHYFLGTYDEWFYQNLGGIQNPKDGYKTVTIRPEIYKKLGYANTSVNTVRGKLVSNWVVNGDNTITMTVTVPVGTTADILLPIAQASSVQLNGAALASQTGIEQIGEKDGRVLVKAISGTYTFQLGADAMVN